MVPIASQYFAKDVITRLGRVIQGYGKVILYVHIGQKDFDKELVSGYPGPAFAEGYGTAGKPGYDKEG